MWGELLVCLGLHKLCVFICFFLFSLQATELINNELPGDMTTTQVTIVVTDIDDQIPVFNENNFHISVSEDIGK